jgi:uncharacterized membrane protein HdeD (DUF308 family)
VNESQKEPKKSRLTKRQRIGRVFLAIGSILAGFSVVCLFTIPAAAFSGADTDVSPLAGLIAPSGVLGVVLILLGLAMVILPDGPSKDGVWVMMLGPFAGRN